MGYRKAEEILPMEIIKLIQRYVDGENIYIPRKENQRKEWGNKTLIRHELERRNIQILMTFKMAIKFKLYHLSIFYQRKAFNVFCEK